ncbi:fungal-specific transcription factor domain protein [Rhizoctonia solani AG-3 Rhs1AP]|uniref:Fungal-specific transcription factor domain protein n=1 Tax=Rhizoctonia solani AG-3 Rhs1AP TaxID=1086054 RepID=X8IWB1_9AGAM|nr:fungal-specific transcription factor domain protein [Rhizoctonia solani AG-3 Rhs1AP]
MMLDNVVDTTMIFSITGHMDPELDFMREAAPIFRRACSCPDSPSKQIHLQALFLQPTDSLRDYAVMDIFSSVITFRPMLFQYDTTFDPELGSSVLNFSDDAGMQWARGLPYQVALVFARINTLRASPAWDLGLFNELETTLQEFVPVPTVSSEPNLVIGRTIVQECWRQAAYIYLYMGLCGAGADDPRVIQALSNFLAVVNSVKPGRVPDSFIIMCFVIASQILSYLNINSSCFPCSQTGVAARNEVDRGNIRYRMLGVEEFGYRGGCALAALEQLWRMADTESRPAVWIDLKWMS